MKKIILTGGGTAGHVTPNIALLPSLTCETEHAFSPESSAAQQRLLPENKHEGEQTNEA